ncbi:small heat shock protein, chloroplastic-like [Punica granatum]|uniref:SHSP domain-containing protein n=2 Tax=Punica granatum TaxID=22663 RepID=A0A218WTH8_PUNGR|nr:small heat shock protein, chloroplastic-like [Punica granatum]OWM76167.1 hypothetical protein CDL15_Pgr009813 [Punica granatum]PKI77061.1 hypothetical protein CRG98_002564 [Punica granatum]
MSQSLCNWRPPLLSPLSRRASRASQPIHSEPLLLLQPTGGRYQSCQAIRAAAADGRDNLDHLQRASGRQQQPKRRVGPVAPIGLWDRFPTARTVQQMMETMDRIMEEPVAYSSGWPSQLPTEAGGFGRGRTPWEIKEGEREYKMRFDMPGMTKEDVKVWVEEKMLVIKAEKAPKKKRGEGEGPESGAGEEEGEGDWSARSYGRYSSRIALPENVRFEKIRAEVKDGVLYITIPKDDNTGKILDINVQ